VGAGEGGATGWAVGRFAIWYGVFGFQRGGKMQEITIKFLERSGNPGLYTRTPAREPELPRLSEAPMRNAMRSNLLVPEVREVMDIRQASDYLGISPDTLYKYASEGFVPAFKLGNRWRFKRSRLDEWMDQQSSLNTANVDPEMKKPVKPAM